VAAALLLSTSTGTIRNLDNERFSAAGTARKRQQSTGTPDLPLSGIRVLAFTQAWAGTFATQLLGLLGADVVQIESCKRPDVWRGAGAPVPPAVRNPDIEQNPLNNNGMYNTVNLNKRSITLDMANPRGRYMFSLMIPNLLCPATHRRQDWACMQPCNRWLHQ